MMKSSFGLAVLLYFISLSDGIAQDGYADGYYISFSQDTTYTKIKVINGIAAKKIGYLNPKGKKRKFNADEIMEYKIDNGAHYASFGPIPKAPNVRYFAEIVADGKVRLLYYGMKKDYYLMRSRSVNVEKVKKLTFKRQLMHYFNDFDDLAEAIKHKKYRYKDVETIVSKYNNWYVEFYIPYLESLEREKRK